MDSSEANMKLLSDDESMSEHGLTCSRCQEVISRGRPAKHFSTLKLCIAFGCCQVLVLVFGLIAFKFVQDDKSNYAKDDNPNDCTSLGARS